MWDDTDDLLVWLFLLGAALAGGPSMLAAAGVDVGAWMVAHQVLVPVGQAVVDLPLVGAGLDWRRLILLIILAAAALTLTIMRISVRRRQAKASD